MKLRCFLFVTMLIAAQLACTQAFGTTIGEVKKDYAHGDPVTLTGKVVTCPYGAYVYRIYVEEPDRSAGIQVFIGSTQLTDATDGAIVDITGTVMDQSYGERMIAVSSITVVSQGEPLEPVRMSNRAVGGQRMGLQTGVEGGLGLNNIGLLVVLTGRVTSVDDTGRYVEIDDGSQLPVQVDVYRFATKPGLHDYISVTGVVSCLPNPVAGLDPIPVIRPRSASDIVNHTPGLEEYIAMPVPAGKVAVFWLGQAGFLFKDHEGRKVVVDPYLSDYAEAVGGSQWARLVPVPIPPENLQPHLTMTTHDHNDHTDPWTLQPICTSSSSLFLGPTSSVAHFQAADIGVPPSRCITLNRGETTTWNGIQITAVYANHTADSVGFVISMAGKKIYISGDTLYDQTLVNSVAAQNPDVMIVSMNGKFDNLTAAEAASLVKACGPQVAIPMHYGMFAINTEDPQVFVDECNAQGVTADVIVTTIGSRILL